MQHLDKSQAEEIGSALIEQERKRTIEIKNETATLVHPIYANPKLRSLAFHEQETLFQEARQTFMQSWKTKIFLLILMVLSCSTMWLIRIKHFSQEYILLTGVITAVIFGIYKIVCVRRILYKITKELLVGRESPRTGIAEQ